MQPYEIWDARFRWEGCDDPRPWLIIDQRGEAFGCFPLSTKCYAGSCFEIETNAVDFPATGLNRDCYIHDERIYELPADSFLKKRGDLQGALLAEFRTFAGL